MKNDSRFFPLVSLLLTATPLLLGAPSIAAGQTEPVEKVLADSTDHMELTGAQVRCGKYFVLESRDFSGFQVKQVHVVLPLSSNVALVSLYYNDIQTVLDESKDSPVLLRMKDESGRETDVVRLSKASFDEAKECLPPPGEK